MVNVNKYTIHGFYGLSWKTLMKTGVVGDMIPQFFSICRCMIGMVKLLLLCLMDLCHVLFVWFLWLLPCCFMPSVDFFRKINLTPQFLCARTDMQTASGDFQTHTASGPNINLPTPEQLEILLLMEELFENSLYPWFFMFCSTSLSAGFLP